MRWHLAVVLWACGCAETGSGTTGSCATDAARAGARYDITKSRFAFGSKPAMQTESGRVRWVGVHGALAVESNGAELAIMNGGAPESALPDWSGDPAKLTAHVTAYWEAMGLAGCQLAQTHVDGSGGGSSNGTVTTSFSGPSTIVLERAVAGVPVVESMATARFNVEDSTTSESFYWPEIPAAAVGAAVAFAQRLADPQALAAYKAKLPADAQGDGAVVIHHSGSFSTAPLTALATYDVVQMAGPLGKAAELSFDETGAAVTRPE